jgi:hypothetical protein
MYVVYSYSDILCKTVSPVPSTQRRVLNIIAKLPTGDDSVGRKVDSTSSIMKWAFFSLGCFGCFLSTCNLTGLGCFFSA